MTDHKTISRVTKFLANEFTKNVGKVSIFKNDDGSYDFFDKYVIAEDAGRYIVTLKNNTDRTLFSSLKNAVAWCVHDNTGRYARANRIQHLDTMISGTELAIEIHRRLIKNSKNSENTLIHLAKLNEEKLKRAAMLNEMDGYLNDSKHLQIKKFAIKDK